MQTISISLPSTEHIQRFVRTLTGRSGEFEVISGNHILDARSMMGLFSLDLSRPIMLKVYHDSPETLDALTPFLSNTEENTHE